MEVDWGPKLLENKQIDWGAHHASTFIHLKYDALYNYPIAIIAFPTLTQS